MTMKQIANRTLTHWKIVLLLVGLGVTGSIAASGLSHLLKDVQIRQVQLQSSKPAPPSDQTPYRSSNALEGSPALVARPSVIAALHRRLGIMTPHGNVSG